jgi:hypothetical protein
MKDKRKINAFPVNERDCSDGMYLRDYFAAKALHIYISLVNNDSGYGYNDIARWSYKIADAMMEEREKE